MLAIYKLEESNFLLYYVMYMWNKCIMNIYYYYYYYYYYYFINFILINYLKK